MSDLYNAFITVPPSDGSRDMTDEIQSIIDEHPNRTIYFPDGIYRISRPILTPADPEKSVSLELSNYATIKASDDWNSEEAMIRLGGKDPMNNIYKVGSNYHLFGGILDGSGKANGVSIDGGRETSIRDVSIKHTKIGLHIKYGANNGSSDADIINVNIVGNRTEDAIGVLVEGHDNTFTNMRIAHVRVGFWIRSGGNFLRTVHPLYTLDFTHYEDGCAFYNEKGRNFFDHCYNDQFAVGFWNVSNRCCTYDHCYNYWYSPKGDVHTAFRATDQFSSLLTNCDADFHFAEPKNVVLEVGNPGGCGRIQNMIVDRKLISPEDAFLHYLSGEPFYRE